MRRLGGLVVGAAVLVAACGGGGGGDDPDLVVAGDEPGPIAEYLELDFSFDDDANEQFREQQRQVDEMVRDCMVAQGFEYTPTTISDSIDTLQARFEDARELPAEEFVDQYGFGITTFDLEAFDAGDVPVDPNDERVSELPQADQDAYYGALYGTFDDEPPFDPSLSDEENAAATEEYYENREPTGCQERAFEHVFSDQEQQFQVFDALSPEFEDLEERFESDPRVVEFHRDWGACMAEAGYPDLEQVDDAYELVYERQSALFESSGVITEAETETGEVTTEDAPAEIEAEGGPAFDDEALEEAQAFELEVARASFDCGGGAGFLHQPRVLADVREELEQQFVDEHRAELDQYRAES